MADLRIAKEAAAAAAVAASEEQAEQDREMDAMFEAAAVAASDVSSPMSTPRGRFGAGGDLAVALAIAEYEANLSAACCKPGSSTLDATAAERQTSSEPGSFRHISADEEGEMRGDGSFSPNTLRRRRNSAAASYSSGGFSPPSMGGMGSRGSLRNMQGMLRRGSEEAIDHAGQLEPWTAVGGGAVQVGENAMWQMPDQAEIDVSGDAALVRAAKRLWRPPPPAQQEWWLSPAAGTGTYAPPPSQGVSPIKRGAVRSAREVAASLLDAEISAAVANAVAAAQPAGVERRVSLAESTDSVERLSPLKAAQKKMEEEEEAQEKIQAAYQARAVRKRVAAKAEVEGKVGTPAARRGSGAQARKEMGEKAAARRVEAKAQAEAEAEGKTGAELRRRASSKEIELRKRASSKEMLGMQTALGAQGLDAKSERSPSRSSMSSETERADAMEKLATGVRGRKARVEVRELREAKKEAHKVVTVAEGGVEKMEARMAEGKLLSAHEVTRLRKECAEAERLAVPMVQKHVRGQQARKEMRGKRHEERHSGPSHGGSSHGSPARAPSHSSGSPGSPSQRADAPARTPARAGRGSKDGSKGAHAKLAEQVDAEAEEIDRLWARQAEGKPLSMHETQRLKEAKEADEAATKYVLDLAARAPLRPEVSVEEKARQKIQAAAHGHAGRKRYKAHKAAQPAGVKAVRRASEAFMKAGHILPPPAVEPPMAVQPGSRLPRQVWLLPPAERRADESAALVAWLRGVPLLREMDEEVLAALAAKAPVAHVSAGQVLYRAAGCEVQCFLLLSGGVAEVLRDEDEYGAERFRLLRASGAGHCVGYGSIHLEGEADGTRGATAVTTEATEAVVMPRRLLEKETRVFTRRLLERKMHILQARRTRIHRCHHTCVHVHTCAHTRTCTHAHTRRLPQSPNPPTPHPPPMPPPHPCAGDAALRSVEGASVGQARHCHAGTTHLTTYLLTLPLTTYLLLTACSSSACRAPSPAPSTRCWPSRASRPTPCCWWPRARCASRAPPAPRWGCAGGGRWGCACWATVSCSRG